MVQLRWVCLNPCCSGRWSRTWQSRDDCWKLCLVLILVVVDDGLVLQNVSADNVVEKVLILICNGRWSRTGTLKLKVTKVVES